jgi:hypothetical protein
VVKAEVTQDIELRDDAEHLAVLDDGEGVEVMGREQCFQFANRHVSRDSDDIAGHVLARSAFEEAINGLAALILCRHASAPSDRSPGPARDLLSRGH